MSAPKDLNTPEHWDMASEGYATRVAPFLMESFADDFESLGVLRKKWSLLDLSKLR